MKKKLYHAFTILMMLCILAAIIALVAHLFGFVAAIITFVLECLFAIWCLYEMKRAIEE